jgi:hypothetical protein
VREEEWKEGMFVCSSAVLDGGMGG